MKGINALTLAIFQLLLSTGQNTTCIKRCMYWAMSSGPTAQQERRSVLTQVCSALGPDLLSSYCTEKLRCKLRMSLKPLLTPELVTCDTAGLNRVPGALGSGHRVCLTVPDPTAGSAPGSPHLRGFRLSPWWLEWERAEPEAAAGTLCSGRGKFQPRAAALPPLAADSPRPGPSGVPTPAAAGRTAGCVGAGGRKGGAGTGTGSLCLRECRSGEGSAFQVSRREVRFCFFPRFCVFFPSAQGVVPPAAGAWLCR